MTAVPVLSRRSVGCISDLTIDRWLLGESPGSDEARRVEEHVKRCASCASRLGALRGLYSTQVPAARHEPPVPLDAVPALVPGQSGALQFVILRDGLLVGTEFFTPGTYMVGSDPRADLQLDGVLPLHARVYFRDGRVALKAEQGALYVNGFKVDSCEVRAIDEVLVGPYVLRSRVIRERWSDVEPGQRRAPASDAELVEDVVTARVEAPEMTVVDRPSTSSSSAAPTPGVEREAAAEVTPPWRGALPSRVPPLPSVAREAASNSAPTPPPATMSPSRRAPAGRPARATTRLSAELWWGDTRQATQSFVAAVTARDFTTWGFAVPDDFVLGEPEADGAWRVRLPTDTAPRVVRRGEAVECRAGALRLVFRVDPVLDRLPSAPLVSWPLAASTVALLAAFFTTMALAPVPEEERFTPHDFKREVTLLFPAPKPPPAPTPVTPGEPTPSRSAEPQVNQPKRRPSTPPPPKPPDRFATLNAMLKGGAMKSLLDPTKGPSAGRPTAGRGRPELLAGVGMGAGGAKGFEFGIRGDGGAGIGAAGASKAGSMTGGGFGVGPIGGRVVRPVATGIATAPGSLHSIDTDAVAKAIASHLAEVSACYERSLLSNGHSGGRLLLEWTITTAGAVSQAKVKSSTLKDATIASCVLSRLKTWSFPRARGGAVVVSYPFVFRASDF